jgi:hypothetical protein
VRIVSACLLGASFLWGCSSGARKEDERPRLAQVVELGGTVEVLRGGQVDWRALAQESALYDDDRLRTFRSAHARLVFDNGSSLRVEEESLITLGGPRGGIFVEHGTVGGSLQSGLALRTPTLEAEREREIVVQ